jgi:hypothetical protein
MTSLPSPPLPPLAPELSAFGIAWWRLAAGRETMISVDAER